MDRAMDISQLTAKERKQARKDLLKKIDAYNKQQRKTRRPSFPLSRPSTDLVYKGIVKVTYDRGYALQTKSLLVESTTTVAEAVVQLFQALGLRGAPMDYALEERNIMTGEIRMLGSNEMPLKLQLGSSQKQSYVELRLVQVRDTLAAPMLSTLSRGGSGALQHAESDESLDREAGHHVVPKEEVIDHGIASVEMLMEEALQDIPPLVQDIQERLRLLSETIAVDGKPRAGLPSRKMLWDILKPQASALVKDIRRLVDNGEFIANKHCTSPDVKLMVTLLLELITDHTRELVSITKQMCGLRGFARIEFSLSISSFIQQITNISHLVGHCHGMLQAMAITAHLLEATAPESFLHGPLQTDSYFRGSGAVSGVLIFCVVSAFLGLVRAAYEDKNEYFASLASNELKSAQQAVDSIQNTNEYTMLHLHPLRSRVRDMEHKMKVAMDNLIRAVKMAASSRPLPYFAPDMLLCGHQLTLATLDFFMVAQCASLMHKVVIAGWELMQLPWVKVYTGSDSGRDTRSEATGTVADQLSSVSDSTSSTGDSGHYRVERTLERRSRIVREEQNVDGMDSPREDSGGRLRFDQLGMRASQLKLPYYRNSGKEDGGRSPGNSPPDTPSTRSASDSSSSSSSSSEASASVRRKPSKVGGASGGGKAGLEKDKSPYMGSDAVRKLKLHYHVNKAIAKGTESLFLTVSQKASILSNVCQEGVKEKYANLVQLLVVAVTRIREEIGMMEVDVLVGKSMSRSIENNQLALEGALRDVQLASLMASGSVAPSSAATKLMTAVNHLKDTCSKSVAAALATAGEHRKALEQAEKMEQEFVSLMTGQRMKEEEEEGVEEGQGIGRRKYSSPAKLAATGEANLAGVVFEDRPAAAPSRGSHSWSLKESPVVVGGTPHQLVLWLTYHRAIDSEFADTFLLTFFSFMTCEQLLSALISRFNLAPSQRLNTLEQEAFQTDITIPVRLRVIHALKVWITNSYDDFKEEGISQNLEKLLKTIESFMPSCAKQLRKSLANNLKLGPAHLQTPPAHSKPPSSLVPPDLASNRSSFDLLDVNSLELARQLTLAHSDLLREIRPQELLSLGWREENTHQLCPHIMQFQQLSRKISQLVSREVQRESLEEDQSSVISYFLQTAKSCRDLKNFAAVFAIMEGLMEREVQEQESAWQLVTDHLLHTYRELQEQVSRDDGYHRYRQDVRVIYQSPVIPSLSVLLSDLEEIDTSHSDSLPGSSPDVVNFEKRRLQARIVYQLQRHQSIPYNLTRVEIMQEYIKDLPEQVPVKDTADDST